MIDRIGVAGVDSIINVKDVLPVELVTGEAHLPKGYIAGGMHVGIKRKKKDLGWIVTETSAEGALVTTQNKYPAAPIVLIRETFGRFGPLKGVIVNSGNANALTGSDGMRDARVMQEKFAELIGARAHEVIIASTGVIGVPLPIEKILHGYDLLREDGALSHHDPEAFAASILTTDTVSKIVSAKLAIDGTVVTVSGYAKGSGMIQPNMATMLAYVMTDAEVKGADLYPLWKSVIQKTFNRISVDGDESTNDMALLLANGAAGVLLAPDHPAWPAFAGAVYAVARELARMIARDGEGATKLLEVVVTGAASEVDADKVGRAIVNSPLVKTAIYGEDANWGRIVAAIGNSGAAFDTQKVSVRIGDVLIFNAGVGLPFVESDVQAYLSGSTVRITVDMGAGDHESEWFGCDLTEGYVRINAHYRT
ncbi:MAG: bifunctional glutamate N-acetyltransferase/amino-acid acetyltransferase ArgJ [Candidatus Carbobacillus altaicus]|nr:bifunctional glutamate N-acetyltransferase/amino-acid acetyltransferase ArgJ [Candidatus Carbobacillus altaicus]